MKTCKQEVILEGIWSSFNTGTAEWWGRTVVLFFRIDWILLRYSEEGRSWVSRKYLGRTSKEPNRASQAEIAEHSLETLRRPSNARGRWLNQPVPDNQALRDTLRQWWNLSTKPLDCGWKGVVGEFMIPRNLQRLIKIELVNWALWWEVITDGTPKVGIQDRSKTVAHSSAVVDWRGIASGHSFIIFSFILVFFYPLIGLQIIMKSNKL